MNVKTNRPKAKLNRLGIRALARRDMNKGRNFSYIDAFFENDGSTGDFSLQVRRDIVNLNYIKEEFPIS